MSKKAVLTLLLLLGVAVVMGLTLRTMRYKKAEPSFEDASSFMSATAITFAQHGARAQDQQITVTDSNTVRRLVATIRLQRTEPCSCAHLLEAIFHTPGGPVPVSFCDHCFDVLQAINSYDGARFYKMPKGFYEEFRTLVQGHTNQTWYVQVP